MYALRFGSTSVVVVIRILALSYCASADYGCDVTSFTVDCFKRGLREVPIAIIPDDVKSLYLGGNLIENIEVLQTIALKKLEYLDLRDNPVAVESVVYYGKFDSPISFGRNSKFDDAGNLG